MPNRNPRKRKSDAIYDLDQDFSLGELATHQIHLAPGAWAAKSSPKSGWQKDATWMVVMDSSASVFSPDEIGRKKQKASTKNGKGQGSDKNDKVQGKGQNQQLKAYFNFKIPNAYWSFGNAEWGKHLKAEERRAAGLSRVFGKGNGKGVPGNANFARLMQDPTWMKFVGSYTGPSPTQARAPQQPSSAKTKFEAQQQESVGKGKGKGAHRSNLPRNAKSANRNRSPMRENSAPPAAEGSPQDDKKVSNYSASAKDMVNVGSPSRNQIRRANDQTPSRAQKKSSQTHGNKLRKGG